MPGSQGMSGVKRQVRLHEKRKRWICKLKYQVVLVCDWKVNAKNNRPCVQGA